MAPLKTLNALIELLAAVGPSEARLLGIEDLEPGLAAAYDQLTGIWQGLTGAVHPATLETDVVDQLSLAFPITPWSHY
ncbi:hypothetical protein [Roseomonas sp. WA12]